MKFNSYINGNYAVAIYEDGTKVRFTKDDEFKPAFNEACDVSITDKCRNLCDFCYQGCTPKGKEADLFSYNFINTLHPFTEVALNGNNLDHPQLLDFLKFLKSKDVIANITVHQNDFMKNIEMLKSWENQGLFKGLGISLSTPTKELIEAIKEFPNAVIHTINGILTKEDIDILKDNDLKILILGYKQLNRGVNYLKVNTDVVEDNQRYLNENLQNLIDNRCFRVISFDNLALEQLEVHKLLSDEQWDKFYMGDDGQFTFFIDMVKNEFAKDSLSQERFPIDNKTIDEMFNFIREKYGKNND